MAACLVLATKFTLWIRRSSKEPLPKQISNFECFPISIFENFYGESSACKETAKGYREEARDIHMILLFYCSMLNSNNSAVI